ncbi:hypothetical protein ACFFGH_22225 [Lysobacter korlensis]|uniref:Uncharacterized protein n=1 Tax=Lysobacter korlensis TaxID=553636 RepID=A0ABV6RU92_9GAMM
MHTSSPIRRDRSAAAAAPFVVPPAFVRLTGAFSLAAMLLFAATMVLPLWPWPEARGYGAIAAIGFQVSVALQLIIVWRTNAVGSHPAWRALVVVAAITAVAGATAEAVDNLTPSATTLTVANATWFLLMAAMVVVGVGVVRSGEWRPPLRYLPLLAHSWPIVLMPATVLLGDDVAWPLYSGYLFLVQTLLAVTLLLRPDLTGARRARTETAG